MPENSICHEIDTGKHFYFGNKAWHELPPKGGSSGGGEGLPDNFPAEGAENVNKFLGFDANGGYTAKDAPAGGGAEKFVVTLTQENDTWTANKTIAEIVAADAENQIVVAKYPDESVYVDLPLSFAVDTQGASGAVFIGLKNSGNDNYIVSVMCLNQGGEDAIQVTKTVIPTSTNAPLIVTLTENSGTLTGDKTYQEVKEARFAGRPVDLVLEGYACASVLDVSGSESSISVTFVADGQIVTATGAPSDYVSKTLS